MSRLALTRRRLLALGAGAALLPRRVFGDGGTGDRKFLFVFCPGGWDPTYVFAPTFGSPQIDMEDGSAPAETNGIAFVDAATRPAVRGFFEKYGDRTCIINGFESRSVAHDVCRHLTMTGSTLPGKDDWAAIMAHHAADDPLIPYMHISGPAYSDAYGSDMVLVGDQGQFTSLIDGTCLTTATPAVAVPTKAVSDLEDAYVLARAREFAASAGRGRAASLGGFAVSTEEDVASVLAAGNSLAIDGATLSGGLTTLIQSFSRKIARCGMIQHNGYNNWGWDTHASNNIQSLHFQELFSALTTAADNMRALPGDRGTLLDDVTIVVMSEMGRYPQLNAFGGKEHWTFTSCMLIGGGIRGGQVVGEYDDQLGGRQVDLGTGEVVEGGTDLLPGHIGATLLTLADVDPAEYLDEPAISAVLA